MEKRKKTINTIQFNSRIYKIEIIYQPRKMQQFINGEKKEKEENDK